MFLVPLRPKNPPERYPYITVLLILLNVFVFLFTTGDLVTVRDTVVDNFAFSHSTFFSQPYRLLTSMFLHGDWFHLLGNMLFLAVFGPAVEGRLGHGKYTFLYFLAGVTASLFHELIVGILAPNQFGLGASGAIMGLIGAYLYLFPFATITVALAYSFGYFGRIRMMDWRAKWVGLWFLGFDLIYGFIDQAMGGQGGVAHFAHIGGAVGGYVAVMFMGAARDTEDVSAAQEQLSDFQGNYRIVDLPRLYALIESQPNNAEAIITYCERALDDSMLGSAGPSQSFTMLSKHADLLARNVDPVRLAELIVQFSPQMGKLPTSILFWIGNRLEGLKADNLACRLFQRTHEQHSTGPDAEIALYRYAKAMAKEPNGAGQAIALFTELARKYPHSLHRDEARAEVRRLNSLAFQN